MLIVCSSVADPDPNPDRIRRRYVFGPPGSGSGPISQRYGSGSFYHKAKIVRKTSIPTALWRFFSFLSLKNDVNVPSKSNTQKNLFLYLFFVGILKFNDENSRIRICIRIRIHQSGMDPRIRIRLHTKMSWIRNTGLYVWSPKDSNGCDSP